MRIRRNRPKPENLNRNATLRFQLRLENFEISDLTKYQADVYCPLNRALRGLEPVRMADLVMAKKIDSAIARAAIPRDMIAYRGFRRNVVNELAPGDTFTDDGFSSASLSETVVRDRFAYGGGAIFQFDPVSARRLLSNIEQGNPARNHLLYGRIDVSEHDDKPTPEETRVVSASLELAPEG